MKTFTRSAAPMVLAAALALTGCSQGQDDTAGQDAQGQQPPATQAEQAPVAQSQQPADASATVEDVTADSAAAAGVDLTAVDPLATATVPAVVEGDADATMEVALLGLRRDGKVLVGTYSFTVTSDAPNPEPRWIYHYLGDQGWDPYLVDTVNLTRHDVLGNGSAQTDYQGPKFLPGQTLYAYAMFAAPAEDVTEMSVSLVDSAPAVTGVPIQ
ncbi:hypothetical protein [Ornithinimicrobium tianjinense]|uniref:DUF4352 domain-containing protein n=1 Tax=Ornithinimicrobium tianjinense TaxID=1195761 RepID=A0A917BQM0_9MICO|nr:hypothetical protein [Ornithinimicrobium tianjinense]GGF55354.1 hypothetical protein GCM10011366_24080 [Ornithinimicrobium tianjinense]